MNLVKIMYYYSHIDQKLKGYMIQVFRNTTSQIIKIEYIPKMPNSNLGSHASSHFSLQTIRFEILTFFPQLKVHCIICQDFVKFFSCFGKFFTVCLELFFDISIWNEKSLISKTESILQVMKQDRRRYIFLSAKFL